MPQSSLPAPGPLAPEHLRELAGARSASRRVRRAAGVARMSGWTTGIFGALTFLSGIFGGLGAVVLGGALIILGIREARLGARLAMFDPAAPRTLAGNQLILGVAIVIYAAWQAWGAVSADPLGAALEPVGDAQADAILAEVRDTTRSIMLIFYAFVGVAGGIGTCSMALYYRGAAARVRAFLREQPAWVVQTLRAAA